LITRYEKLIDARLRQLQRSVLVALLVSGIVAANSVVAPEAHGEAIVPAALIDAGSIEAPAAAESAFESADADAEIAVTELSKHVKRSSDPTALRTAFGAYYRYRATHPERVKKPYLYYVDLGLDNKTARGFIFDMQAFKVVEGPFNVAHGRGSSAERDGVPTRFSNTPGSNASSLGLYLAADTYAFSGKSAGKPYTSIGLRLLGESGAFNDAAAARGIVAHGAPYVTPRAAGRSEGCPAMELSRARRLIPLLANGGVVFLYSPNPPDWLDAEPNLR
jgi:hypothetical protein